MRYVSLIVAAIVVPLSFWWFFTLREPGFHKAAHQAHRFGRMQRTVRNSNLIYLHGKFHVVVGLQLRAAARLVHPNVLRIRR